MLWAVDMYKYFITLGSAGLDKALYKYRPFTMCRHNVYVLLDSNYIHPLSLETFLCLHDSELRVK